MNNSEEISFKEVFIYVIGFIRKYYLLLIFFPPLIVLLHSGYLYFQPKVYKADMYGYSDYISDTRIMDIFDEFNYNLRFKHLKNVSKQLDLPLEYVQKIQKIEVSTAVEIDKGFKNEQDISKTNFLKFEAYVYENTILDTVQAAIINYIGGLDFVKQQMQVRENLREEFKQKANSEFHKIDSIRSELLENMKTSDSKFNIINMADFSSAKINIQDKLNEFLLENEYLEPLYVIKPFYEVPKPYYPRYIKDNILVIKLGFLFAFLIAIFLEIRLYYIKTIKTSAE